MIKRLQEAVAVDLGVKPAGSAEIEKKKSGAAGTTPNANTGSHNANGATTTGAATSSQSTTAGTESHQGNGATGEAGAESAAVAESGDAQGEDGSDGSGAASEEIDPLKLLEAKPDAEASTDKTTGDGAANQAKAATTGGALRAQLERTISENRTLAQKLKELEGANNPKVKELTTAFEAERKRREELETQIAQLDYSQSPEFKRQYIAPYENALQDTLQRLGSMSKDDGSKLTKEEVESLVTGGEDVAGKLIDSMFSGTKAMTAVGMINNLYSLERTQARAFQNARSTALSRRKEQEASETAARQAMWQHYEEERDARFAKVPELSSPKEGDTKHKRTLAEGIALADAAITPPKNATPQQRMAIMAEVRNRAALQPVAIELWKREKARADAAEAELAKYRNHEPGRGETESVASSGKKAEPGTMEFAVESLREVAGL